jgi:hypothetical protein
MVSFAREYRVVERIAELGIYRSRPHVDTQSIPSKSWWSVPAQRCGLPLGVEHGGAKIDSIATMCQRCYAAPIRRAPTGGSSAPHRLGHSGEHKAMPIGAAQCQVLSGQFGAIAMKKPQRRSSTFAALGEYCQLGERAAMKVAVKGSTLSDLEAICLASVILGVVCLAFM